jgi:CubicO group peptidase (beta-lactamase class C family)
MRVLTIAAVAALALIGAPAFTAPAPALVAAPAKASPATPAAAPAAHTITKADVDVWLDGLIPYALKATDIPGAIVVVVKDGQVVTERGFGYSDVAAKKPVDPVTTLFRPGSITKTFTWTAVMQLVEAGKLDLDADVNKYLDFKIPPRDGQPITLRNIMTHTPGFEEKYKYLMSNKPDTTLEQYIKGWTPKRVFAPGKVPAYSNYGAALAGYIVQRVSGQPWADYVQTHILTPLDMSHSSVAMPFPASVLPNLAKGYHAGADGPEFYTEYVPPAPAGNLAASGDDMAHFMIAHLQNGRYGSVQILKPETAIAMHATQPKVYPALNGMALGFVEDHRNGHRVIWHNGGTQVFLSDMKLFIDDNVGIFISLNSPGKGGGADSIHAALYHGFADRYFPGKPPLPPMIDKATAMAHAKLMAGQWENSRRDYSSFPSLSALLSPTVVVANSDGTVSLGRPGAGPKWREVQPFVWVNTEDTNDMMQAVLTNGRPTMFGFSMAPPAAFLRIPAWRAPGWMAPTLYVSLAILLLTALLWPVRALARRHYGSAFALQGRDVMVYRATRAFALAAVVAFAAYPVFLSWVLGDISHASDASNVTVITLGLVALVAFVGVAVFAVWNAARVWRSGGWFGKLCSVLVAASALFVLWIGFLFHLVGVNTQY